MSQTNKHTSIEKGSEKSFGIVFSVVFLIIGLYPLTYSKEFYLWSIIISFIFLILAYFTPKILYIPNKLWFKFGIIIASITTPIIMILVYLISVLPIGIIIKLLGKKLIDKKFDKNIKSYWIKKSEPTGSMKYQF